MPKEAVRNYWQREPCGVRGVGEKDRRTFFRHLERQRYQIDAHIPGFAQFERGRGKDVLEIGVGAGTDFVNWLRHGANAVGVDLTTAAVELTKERLELEGLAAQVLVADAEKLPFADESFDIVYSYGVLHHSPDTRKAVDEVYRVLRPNGVALLMVYHVPSWTGFLLWGLRCITDGEFFESPRQAIFAQLESPGTKAYTLPEASALVSKFSNVELRTVLLAGDLLQMQPSAKYDDPLYRFIWRLYPRDIIRRLGTKLGLGLLISARKANLAHDHDRAVLNEDIRPEPAMIAEHDSAANSLSIQPLAVIVLTLDEEWNLQKAMASVPAGIPVIVIDSGSTDRTKAIARDLGAELHEHAFEDYASQRNFALQMTRDRFRWVFFLDADEEITEELWQDVVATIARDDVDGAYVGLTLRMLGRELRHGGVGHYQGLRLMRPDKAKFVRGINERVDDSELRTVRLYSKILHYDLKPITQWFMKHVRYAEREANAYLVGRNERRGLQGFKLSTKGSRMIGIRWAYDKLPLFIRPFFQFGRALVWQSGWKDGLAGLMFAGMQSLWYPMIIDLLIFEARLRRLTGGSAPDEQQSNERIR